MGFGVLGALLLANFLGIRTILLYVLLGILVWLAFLQSGVHATIAGVLVAWKIPAHNCIDPAVFLEQARGILPHFEKGPLDSVTMLAATCHHRFGSSL